MWPLNMKVVELEANRSTSPEYHIKLTLFLAFIFDNNRHIDHHARADACITIPQDLTLNDSVCREKLILSLIAALRSSYLPHLNGRMTAFTSHLAARTAISALQVEPMCTYNVALSVEFLNAGRGEEFRSFLFSDDATYFAIAEMFEVHDPEAEESFCRICLEDFDDGTAQAALLPCKHLFHGDCIIRWTGTKADQLRRPCPTCYVPVEKVFHYCKLCRGVSSMSIHNTLVDMMERGVSSMSIHNRLADMME